MPYRIETNNPGCIEGYAVVKESNGKLVFCHKTRREAKAQIAAIEMSENYRAEAQPAPEAEQIEGSSTNEPEERAEMYPTTEAMKAEARRGLEWRKTFGRGGTPIGVSSAREIIAGSVTYSRVLRIRSFLARHEIDKQGQGFSPFEDGYPSAGRIAWALWGGDPGQTWAENIVATAAE